MVKDLQNIAHDRIQRRIHSELYHTFHPIIEEINKNIKKCGGRVIE
jgi:hypothetical protein